MPNAAVFWWRGAGAKSPAWELSLGSALRVLDPSAAPDGTVMVERKLWPVCLSSAYVVGADRVPFTQGCIFGKLLFYQESDKVSNLKLPE